MYLASPRSTFHPQLAPHGAQNALPSDVFTIVDKATHNFKQTSMLCLNHITNRAYNTDKSVIFVKMKDHYG